jgi:hypothetical protein
MSLKTNKKPSWMQQYLLHPALFGLYPILALLAFNVAELDTSLGYRALLLSLGVAMLLTIVLHFIYRDWKTAALVSTVLLILFYSYGHVYIALKGIEWGGVFIFRHRTLIPLWGVAGFVLIWWTSRRSFNLPTATSMLNTAGLFLLILPVYQLISYPIQSRMAADNVEEGVLSLRIDDTLPDIYYIILDGYGRSDVLKDEYGFDNSEFLNSLKDLGFYVADCSQSNYAQTQISIASTLNFDYIDALGSFVPGSDDRGQLEALIKQSAVRRALEAAGYKTIAFATGFNWTQLDNANYYLAPQSRAGNLNEFEKLLLETTFARIIQDYALLGEQDSGSSLYRERTLFALEKLDELSYIKEPKFVFVHIIAPHPPYVFGPTGGPIAASDVGTTRSDREPELYRDQVTYITNRIKEIVPNIIANSARPPIIIIQGDHGPTVASNPQSRMKNLSVYYLPGVDAELYPTITPVNSFRVIFNAYFGQDLPLLEDVSQYSVYTDPFSFKTIPDSCE